jgi:hypothetical protein
MDVSQMGYLCVIDAIPRVAFGPSEQVGQIRQRYVPRRVSMKRLADEYGVNPATVFYVIHGRTWTSSDEGAPG